MRSLHRRPSLDLVGNPFADVIRRHEQRHQMRRAGARAGGVDAWREADEASPEPPSGELDADYYGAGEQEGRLRLQIEDASDDGEEMPSAEQSSSSAGGRQLELSGLSEEDPNNRWYSKR